nr:MAG TPA: hypothetical protein [Caudoviricetes sp.]
MQIAHPKKMGLMPLDRIQALTVSSIACQSISPS